MSVEENKLIAHRFFEEVWNQGNLDVFDELITSRIVLHVGSKDFKGFEKYKKLILGYRNAFPISNSQLMNR